MPTVAVLALSGATLWITSFILRKFYRSGSLTARRFALVLASGWCIAILIEFFLGLAKLLIETRDLGLGLLGIGIVALNFALAFPIAHFFYDRVISRAARRPPPPQS